MVGISTGIVLARRSRLHFLASLDVTAPGMP